MRRITIAAVLAIVLAALVAGACYLSYGGYYDGYYDDYYGDYYGDGYVYRWPHVLTLKEFDDYSYLRAVPANFVVVAFWQGISDIVEGEPIAAIPYSFPYTAEFTFCWEVTAEDTAEHMTLIDGDGAEVMRMEAGGDCVKQLIIAGRFDMRFYRDDTNVRVPIFIRPNPDILVYWFDPYNAPLPTAFDLTTNACPGCNIAVGDFFRANFTGCNLAGADLNEAYLYQATLAEADLTDAYCRGAILEQADLADAILDGADFSYATWVDGVACGSNSIGGCN